MTLLKILWTLFVLVSVVSFLSVGNRNLSLIMIRVLTLTGGIVLIAQIWIMFP